MKQNFFITLLLLAGIATKAQSQTAQPAFLNEQTIRWADSVLATLSVDERIGQLFMVAAYSNKDKKHVAEIDSLITNYHIGGLIFFQGGPLRQALQTNHYQQLSKLPLLIGFDGEWGLAMRLDSTQKYPHQMTLGAIRNDSLLQQMGAEIGRQCLRLGIHCNFAPVVDVNANPKNPVIGVRSFGSNKLLVAQKGIAYMNGMQSVGLLTTGKHFPGHGDTDVDSHKDLPVIKHRMKRLDTLEFYPFRQLIDNGLSGMMVAHLFIPAIDDTKNLPSTLSPKVVNKLLQTDMNFRGLVFTDALNMKGASKYFTAGEAELKALMAGNDVLLFPQDVPLAVTKIKEALETKRLSQLDVDRHCHKILCAKRWMGLTHTPTIDTSNLMADLHTPQSDVLMRRLTQSAITVVKNKKNLLPLQRLDTLRIASLSIGATRDTSFQPTLAKYAKVRHFTALKTVSDTTISLLCSKLKAFNVVIIGVHETSIRRDKHYGISEQTAKLVKRLSAQCKVVLAVFANPYSLEYFDSLSAVNAIVLGYDDSDYARYYTAQAIFGGIACDGRLPVPVVGYPAGTGAVTPKIRLKYTSLGDAGLPHDAFRGIDSIARSAIAQGVFPGCQVLVAKDDAVIYSRSFGYQTYDRNVAVDDTTIYDLASLTKITATMPSLMLLHDWGRFSPSAQLCDYLPELDSTNKGSLWVSDVLRHQARLKPWIPFFMSMVDGFDTRRAQVASDKQSADFPFLSLSNTWLHKDYKLRTDVLRHQSNDTFSVCVADSLWIHRSYPDSINLKIDQSELMSTKAYRYSDLGFYYFRRVVERISHTPLDSFTDIHFYEPLGANFTGFCPLQRFPRAQIAPTEFDKIFRQQLVHGYVHDPGAAMLGGVSGHAGLFGTANDVAKLLQMYLNGGWYGGTRFFRPATVQLYTQTPWSDGNHRSMGFDKPNPDLRRSSACPSVSPESYGHTGFTGNMVWVDPCYRLVFIFLSNRVYPDAENTLISKLNIRPSVQQVVYNAVTK